MYRQLIIQLLMLLLVSPAANAQKKSKEEPPVQLAANARAMQVMMETHHCSPRIKDSQYYKDVAALFLKSLDPLRIYLTQEDVKMINDTVALKDELQGHNQNYSKSIIMLFKERLLGANRQITDIARTPFNFNLNESIFTEEDSIPYAADDKGLRDNMYKLMKFNTLDRIMEGELLDSTLRTTPVEQREPKEREIAAKIRHRRVKQRLETKWGFDNLVNIYLANAVVKAYDPHSEFIPELSDKRNRYMLTASPGAFGLVLKENYKGDVVVAKLIPGSSAWKSGVINKDDVLVHLQWEEDTPIDLEGADLDEVEVAFGSKRYRKLKLTVLKPDGQTRTALLSRGWYYVEGENHVQGYILDGPVKLGYIVLPSFYGDWESVYGSSCARDVDKTIEKMQFQVEGIILDMRNNGGGSLGEANQLAGIFIDEGPLGFRKQRNGFSTEMTDPYLGAQYDGPLVVMVNNESASATEYVAAALQDYNRAVIVGSPTFGKATAQRYLPADSTLERFDIDFGNFQSDVKDKVKITIAKLYRVNGLNNQLRGVQPDILLPDVFDSLGYREQYMSHYLSLDTLKRKGVYEPFRPLPIAALRQKSEQRIAQTPGFKLVAEGNKLYTERKKLIEKPLSLQYSAFTDLSKKYIARGRKVLKDIREDSTHIYSTTNYYRVAPDPNKKPDEWEVEINNKVLENITRDIYVHEAFAIVKDMIDLKKK